MADETPKRPAERLDYRSFPNDDSYRIDLPEDSFDVVERRRSFAVQSIVETRLDLEERKRLGKAQEQTLDDLASDVRLQLSAIAQGPVGPDGQRLYQDLQKTLADVQHRRTQAAIDTWRDAVELKQNLRALLREYWGTPRP